MLQGRTLTQNFHIAQPSQARFIFPWVCHLMMGVPLAMSTLPCCTPGLHQQMGDLSARAQRSLTMFDSHDEHSAQPSDQARKTLNLVPTTFITADSSKLSRTLCKMHLVKHVLTGLPGSKNFCFRSSKNLRFRN